VALLARPAPGLALKHMPPIRAVHVTVIADAAQVEHPAAVVDDALDLPEIVHSRTRPQGTRPPSRTRATTIASNASTRGDLGSELAAPGPFLFGGAGDRPPPASPGPTTPSAALAQISALSGARRHLVPPRPHDALGNHSSPPKRSTPRIRVIRSRKDRNMSETYNPPQRAPELPSSAASALDLNRQMASNSRA
jgi:hypothetical protein